MAEVVFKLRRAPPKRGWSALEPWRDLYCTIGDNKKDTSDNITRYSGLSAMFLFLSSPFTHKALQGHAGPPHQRQQRRRKHSIEALEKSGVVPANAGSDRTAVVAAAASAEVAAREGPVLVEANSFLEQPKDSMPRLFAGFGTPTRSAPISPRR